MRRRLVTALLVMGFSGIVAQVLLLRELLVTFYGNELSIGIILANWLILEAAGSFFLGRRIERAQARILFFVAVQLVFAFSLPVAVYLARVLKELIGVTSGEGVGLWPILYSSFLVLLPISLTHGALFTFGCKIYSQASPDITSGPSRQTAAAAIGRVYIYETLGTILGGLAFTYILISYFHSFQIALGVSLVNIVVCLWLLGRSGGKAAKVWGAFSLLGLVVCGYLVLPGPANRLHWASARAQWPGQELIHYQNSIYGNVAVTQAQGQYTFFSDGIPIVTTPSPDLVFVEEFAHLPLLYHPAPRQALVASGGAGGLINELLKHRLKQIDYVELDPLLLETVKKFPTALTDLELSDKRVNVEHVDARLFIRNTPRKYDVVLVGLSAPSDLQLNRFFTREFFSLVKQRMRPGGILAITLPGSLNYLTDELKNLNACIWTTLKAVYPYTWVIPGDGTNLYLASTSTDFSLVSSQELGLRLARRGLNAQLLIPQYIDYKLQSRFRHWLEEGLAASSAKINQDFRPLGLFYSISYWNSIFSPYLRRAFNLFAGIELWMLVIPLIVLVGLFLFKRSAPFSITLAVATSGLAGMIFDLALIFTFQALYGYVYHWVGLLITAFMVGVAVSAGIVTYLLPRLKRDIRCFIRLEGALVIFSGLLPLVFILFHPYWDQPGVASLLQVVFLVLCFISGGLVGSQFPLANQIYLRLRGGQLAGSAGTLYAADLLGGWLGGIVGAVVLLPVLGLVGSCLVAASFKLASLIIVLVSTRGVR